VAAIPRAVTELTLEEPEHLPAAREWAAVNGLDLVFDADALTVDVALSGPPAEPDAAPERYLIRGWLEDFDALPILWRFLDPRNGQEVGTAAYPQAASGTVFHGQGLICAPWSRLAYQLHGGPHTDWGALTDWKTFRPPYTYAVTIPDMLDRLLRDTQKSTGRMAPLPVLP
jgi:hypothetical protein